MYVTSENGVWLRSSCSTNTNDNKIKVLGYKTEVTVTGEGNGWYRVNYEGKEGYVAGYLTDKKPEEEKNESSTATLANIVVSPQKLNETFSKDKYDYTMTVEADVDSVEVKATPTDDKAKVTVTGNTGLTTGTGNTIVVKVVAEDGISSKTYRIKVTKLATEDEDPNIIEEPNEEKYGLKSLEIEGIKLTPIFKSEVYEYTATITDKSIEELKINAISIDEKSKVEIVGADKIKDGENIITITVTTEGENEEETRTVTYKITVTKKEAVAVTVPKTENKNDGSGKLILVIGAAAAIVALILVFVIIRNKDKRPKAVSGFEDGDYNESEEDYNSYSKSERENKEDNERQDDEEYEDDDEDDDWGVPKRGLFNKFKSTGRHF